MIRRATESDIPAIVALGEEFTTECVTAVQYDPHGTGLFIQQMLRFPQAAIFVIDLNGEVVGMAGALVAPVFFAPRSRHATEMFWFVRKAHRKTFDSLRLFKAIEDWAREQGAEAMVMVALGTNPEVRHIYERRGYALHETHYIRSL